MNVSYKLSTVLYKCKGYYPYHFINLYVVVCFQDICLPKADLPLSIFLITEKEKELAV